MDMKNGILFKDESFRIIGACFEVYNEKGNGFLEAVKTLTDEHRAQVINYLKSTGMKLGLLVNFGHHLRLEHERFINQK